MLINFGSNPFLGILMGFGLTLLLQSSSASIGILIALAAEGLLPITAALPILYGDNIGTCTTALDFKYRSKQKCPESSDNAPYV